MRILSITAQKPNSTGSGVYLTELVKEFQKMGDVQAVIAGITKADQVMFPEGTRFYPVYFQEEELPFPVTGMSDEMPYESTRYCHMTEEMCQKFCTAFGSRLKEVICEFRPDLILCHHLYLLTALARELYPDQKIMAICHGSDLRQIKKNPLMREWIVSQIQKLDRIFALHEEQKAEIIEIFGCQKERISVIGTGYNNQIFHREKEAKREREAEFEGEKKQLRLIFAGKVSEKKGVKSLIRSLEYLPYEAEDLVLSLAGGAGNQMEYQEICHLADACKYRVEFLGKLSQEELAEELRHSDMFVLPSFYEGLPLVTIEALACKTKVICTDLPGIRPWMDQMLEGHDTIFVTPPAMQNEDEPIPKCLPEFERRLAQAIETSAEMPEQQARGLEELTWGSICRKIKSHL